jgi:hypothetical protein
MFLKTLREKSFLQVRFLILRQGEVFPKAWLDSWYCFTIKPISITKTFSHEFYAATQLTIFIRQSQIADQGFILCLNCPSEAQRHLQSALLGDRVGDILQCAVSCLETVKELYDEAVQRLRYQVRGIELVRLLKHVWPYINGSRSVPDRGIMSSPTLFDCMTSQCILSNR